ncbi:MAG: hypothetical protein IPK75_02170 [Acidobacteria bacterium]|nr:hypothetical protein [Acidobacteriota bacterium]
MADDWSFWLMRILVVSVLGTAIIVTERLFSKVQGWGKWVAVFGLPLAASALLILICLTDSAMTRAIPEDARILIVGSAFLFGFICFAAFAFSTVRWIDSWERRDGNKGKHDQN